MVICNRCKKSEYTYIQRSTKGHNASNKSSYNLFVVRCAVTTHIAHKSCQNDKRPAFGWLPQRQWCEWKVLWNLDVSHQYAVARTGRRAFFGSPSTLCHLLENPIRAIAMLSAPCWPFGVLWRLCCTTGDAATILTIDVTFKSPLPATYLWGIYLSALFLLFVRGSYVCELSLNKLKPIGCH